MITEQRWEEIQRVREAAANAHAYMWGVMRNADTYVSNIQDKWRKQRLVKYFKDFCKRVRHFDEDLEIFLTKEDKKAINQIIKNRLEILITGQEELP